MKSPVKQKTQRSLMRAANELKRTETLEGDRLRRLLAGEVVEVTG